MLSTPGAPSDVSVLGAQTRNLWVGDKTGLCYG